MTAAASCGRWKKRRKFQGLETALLQVGRACVEVSEEQENEGDQSPAEHPFQGPEKPERWNSVSATFWWFHWLWAAAYPGRIAMWHKASFPVCISSPALKKGLIKGKRWINKGSPLLLPYILLSSWKLKLWK